MLTNEGTNSQGQTHWKLHVPDEHCRPGLEVGVFATPNGLMIGGNMIPWADLAVAKLRALGSTFERLGAPQCHNCGSRHFPGENSECEV